MGVFQQSPHKNQPTIFFLQILVLINRWIFINILLNRVYSQTMARNCWWGSELIELSRSLPFYPRHHVPIWTLCPQIGTVPDWFLYVFLAFCVLFYRLDIFLCGQCTVPLFLLMCIHPGSEEILFPQLRRLFSGNRIGNPRSNDSSLIYFLTTKIR